MSGPERGFVTSVNKYLAPGLHHEGMANPYRGGTPDHWYSGKRDLWVEFKWVELPKRPDTLISIVAFTAKVKPSMSALQQNWNIQRRAEGRDVWVIIGCSKGGFIIKEGEWSQSWRADHFMSRLLPKKEIAQSISSFCKD